MGARIDMEVGSVWGRLTVIGRAPDFITSRGKPVIAWRCRCECGEECNVYGYALRNGHTKSCGCYNHDVITTHGRTKDYTYKTWDSMKQRCNNANAPDYPSYGGRGIRICPRWDNSFEAFVEDMGDRPRGMSIERLDVNGNYEPGNCIWATIQQQADNKRTKRLVEMGGRTQSVMQWCREYGLARQETMRVYARLNLGWPLREALTVRKNGRT